MRKRHVVKLNHEFLVVSHSFSSLENKVPTVTRLKAVRFAIDRDASVRNAQTNKWLSSDLVF